MKYLLGSIYSWFESFTSMNLANYLWGYNCATGDFSNAIGFNQIGLITMGITLFFVIAYYYIINHPSFNRWWSWAIMLLLNSFVALFLGNWWTAKDLVGGIIGDCLMFTRNEEGEAILQLISKSDCWGFGFANFFFAGMFFILFSLLLNWGSSNCKHSPFI